MRESGWHPRIATSVGGAMAYTKYGFVIRWIINRISRQKGGPTDTSRDHELTDWSAVDGFATQFAAMLPTTAATGADARTEAR